MEVIHLARLVPEQTKKFGDKTVMRFRDYTDGKWKDIIQHYGETIASLY